MGNATVGTLSNHRARLDELAELGQQLRVDSVRCSNAAGSGHPTSSMSAADLMAVLLAEHLRYDFANPEHPGNDHLIFSKGHASPLLYAMYAAAGAIDDNELLGFRKAGSRLEGHPTPQLPWVEVATGSLGQGLPVGVGMALAGGMTPLPYRVWVLCGDSELAEGSMWEAIEHAGYVQLPNLTAIVDVNRLGQRGPTRYGWDTRTYAKRFTAFGWRTVEVDGHDIGAIDHAYRQAIEHNGPTVILARTQKGRGVSTVEDQEGRHGKPLEDVDEAISELGGRRDIRVTVHGPPEVGLPAGTDPRELTLPSYATGDQVATRTAFGDAVTAVGDARPDVVVLDGEVADSTRAEYFARAHPERFIECYIAEQQLVAAAVGLQACRFRPYAATFAAFLTRAYDFIRMASIGRANLRLVGSHAGVAIGPDGPSQMGLEDLAMFRAVHGSTVLYPCDANQAAQLTASMADLNGVSYLRTTRGNTPVIYEPSERFPVGGSRVLRSSQDDRITLLAAGVTVFESLRAADTLAEQGVRVRVIDLYSLKPIDAATIRQAAADTKAFLTVEDHRPEGGLGDAVLDVFTDGTPCPRVRKLAVRGMPASASADEQLRAAGIDADTIVTACGRLLEG